MDFINLPILIFSVLLSLSILTSLISFRVGVPLILLLLCMGLLTGIGGFEFLEVFRRPKIAFFIGSACLAVILFDSGFHTKMSSFRQASKAAVLLATVGVFLTTVLLAPLAKVILGFDWLSVFLLAAIISSTDAAAVFFLLRSQGVALREKVKATLEVESGSNDPMAIFLTLAFLVLVQQSNLNEPISYSFLLPSFLGQLFIGAGAGFLMAELIQFCVRHVRLDAALYPIFVLGLALLGFALTNMLGGSGFLSIYIAGVLLGNARLTAYVQISKFQRTVAWLSQITMFTSLGLFVTIDGLKQVFIPALLLGVCLTFIARPVMTFMLMAFFKSYQFKEKIFISFVGLRGATSILLAVAPIVYQVTHAEEFFNIIFVMVLFSLSIQGYFIPQMAKWCGVALPISTSETEKTQLDLPGLTDSSLLVYKLSDQSPVLNGTAIPRWAKPSLVVRDSIAYPAGSLLKQLKTGDLVYVFSPSERRQPLLDKIFSAPADTSETADFGDFVIAPSVTFGELEKIYHVSAGKQLQHIKIADLIQSEFKDIEVGDRLSLDAIDLVVRSIENGVPTSIGLDIDPAHRQSFKTKTYVLKLIRPQHKKIKS